MPDNDSSYFALWHFCMATFLKFDWKGVRLHDPRCHCTFSGPPHTSAAGTLSSSTVVQMLLADCWSCQLVILHNKLLLKLFNDRERWMKICTLYCPRLESVKFCCVRHLRLSILMEHLPQKYCELQWLGFLPHKTIVSGYLYTEVVWGLDMCGPKIEDVIDTC